MSLHPLASSWIRFRSPRTRPAARVPCILLAATLAACGSPEAAPPAEVPATQVDSPAAPAPSTPPADAPPPAPPPADEAEEPGSQSAGWTSGIIDVRRQVGGAALLRDVRTARHEGFDRIVLDFGDSGVPGYHLEYIDKPVRQCGSGDVVPLAGDAWLQIRVEPASAHTEEGQPTIRERARSPEHPNVWELKMVCDFEAQVEWVAGVRTPAPFRAFVLHEPDRLVVDVRTR